MASNKISILLADVDGTLVTKEKLLTERAIAAVHKLHDRGIKFAITSGRPPAWHVDGDRTAQDRHADRRPSTAA